MGLPPKRGAKSTLAAVHPRAPPGRCRSGLCQCQSSDYWL